MRKPTYKVDVEKRNRLIAKYSPDLLLPEDDHTGRLRDDDSSDAVDTIGIEEFFDGNRDRGSIAPNLSGAPTDPGLELIRDTLISIRARPDVADVRAAIDEWPNPHHRGDDNMWPYAETIYIWTTAPRDRVEQWVEGLQVDGVWEVSMDEAVKINPPNIGNGHHLYALSWD